MSELFSKAWPRRITSFLLPRSIREQTEETLKLVGKAVSTCPETTLKQTFEWCHILWLIDIVKYVRAENMAHMFLRNL